MTSCMLTSDAAFFIQAEDGIRDFHVTGVQTCALPISNGLPEFSFILVGWGSDTGETSSPLKTLLGTFKIGRASGREGVEAAVAVVLLNGDERPAARAGKRRVGQRTSEGGLLLSESDSA